MVSIIVATARGGVIGKTGGIPWYLPADLAHFKKLTMGHPIIMGRLTHESIGRALPGRKNIIVSRNKAYRTEGCSTVPSLHEAIKAAGADEQIFIIGGESIYRQALPQTQRIYLTRINADIAGDKFFKFNRSQWRQVSSEEHQPDDKNSYAYEFAVLERRVP